MTMIMLVLLLLLLMHQATLIHSTVNGDDLVSYMARVSNPKNQDNKATAPKLIKYLIDHKHWSPFEMVNMCVEIETTRSIAAQILRHRSFSFQEFSQRYAKASKPVVNELRRQDVSNRQNSVDDLDPFTVQEFQIKQQSINDLSYSLYEEMLSAGVAKECARDVLPLCTPTKLYMNGSLRSWYHYCDLRAGHGTQKEHMLIAESCMECIAVAFPQCYAAFWS